MKHMRTFLGILSLLLIVCANSANAQVPSGYLSTDQITGVALNGADRSAVVLIHGWNPDGYSDKFADGDGDWPQLVNALSTKLNGTGTKLLLFHWEDDASTGSIQFWSTFPGQAGFYNGWAAAENGSVNGMRLGEALNTAASELRKITFIAHSAGSWVAYRAIDRLLRINPYVVVNLVLLDPFIPGVVQKLNTTLDTATMSELATEDQYSDRIFRLENYYAIDITDNYVAALDGGGSKATSQEFTWRNHDINLRTDYNSIPRGYYDGHGGPIRFYADTVTATASGATIPDGLTDAPWPYRIVGFYRSLAYLPSLARIIVQPQAPTQPAQIGQTVTLSVSAHFADSFQWFKDGNQLNSETNATLWLNSVSNSDAGGYVVRVTNANGHIFSEKAVLQIAGPPPVINAVSVSPDLGCLASSNRQWIDIDGQWFLYSSQVILNDGTTSYNIPEERTEYIDDTHIRVCAGVRYTSNWTAQVKNPANSSNEYAFTVPLPGAPTVSISAVPSNIASGSSSTISWSSTNSISCAASGGWAGAKSTSGSQSVIPGSTTTYTLTCTGSGGAASNSTTVTVSGGTPAPLVYLSATPDSVSSGQQVSLGWATLNTTSCSSSWGSSVPLTGNATVYPTVTTTYTLTCNGAGGSNSDSVTVGVGTLAPVSLTAAPPAIPSGGSSTLSWSTNGMASCLASGGWSGSQPLNGNTSVSPSSNTTYTLTCTGSGGTPTELVQNGAFAGSTTQWTKSGNFYANSEFGNCNNSCDGYAYISASNGLLSASNNLSGSMYQDIYLPSSASSITLTLWLSISTEETIASAYDTLNVTIRDTANNILVTYLNASNVHAGGYRQIPNLDLTNFRGQTIRLYFEASTDSSYGTVFRVDDVSITSTASTQHSDSTTVTVIPLSPPTLTFTAAPDHISSGGSSILSWSSANTTSCSASGGWSGTRGISGSQTVYPTQNTTYSLSCTGLGGTVNGNVTIAVTSPLPTVNLSASSTTINEGDTSTLNWTSTNATNCTAYGEWGGEGSKATSGSQVVAPTSTASYTLSCSGTGGSSSNTATINVVPHTITITSAANGTPNPVDSGGTINLSVSASDSFGHGLSYVWSASCSGLASNGAFSNENIQNPTWIAPANTGGQENCTITVAISDNTGLFSSSSYFQVVSSAITTYTLNISATNGAVSKDPYQASYSAGSQVTLTATPDSGYQFDGWVGDASGATNPLTLTMDGNKNVTANFTAIPQDLGSIRVTIITQAAADSGAQWRVAGESTWHNSGAIKSNVPYGTYHIEFSTVSGWGTPSNKEVTVSAANQNPLINSDNYIEQPLSSIEAPSNLQAVAASNSSIALRWIDNSDNEEAFIIETRIGMNGSFNHRVNWNPNSTSWTDDGYGSGLEGGVIYCYRVKAWASALGDSSYSNEVCATTQLTAIPGMPATLVSDTSKYWAITMDSSNVYWTDVGSSAIRQIPKTGGAVTTLASTPSGSALAISVFNDYVYWAESGWGESGREAGSIKMAPIGGGTVTTIASGDTMGAYSGIRGLAVDSTGIYWTVAGDNFGYDGLVMALSGVPVDNPSLLATTTPIILADGLKNPESLAIDNTHVYWIESDCCAVNGAEGKVRKISKNGGSISTLVSDLYEVTGLSVDTNNVYFGEWNGNIYKVPINGGTVINLGGGLASNFIAIDNTNVYFANVWGDSVYKVAKDGSDWNQFGGGITPVASGLTSPWAIAVDDSGIYWTECPTCIPASGAIKVFVTPTFPGDIDGNNTIDLQDAILAMQVVNNVTPALNIKIKADVNGDNKIGIEEAIYILQILFGQNKQP